MPRVVRQPYVIPLALCLAGWGVDQTHAGWAQNTAELTPATFDDTVLKSDSIWMVAFYAPWCGHCKNLASPWGKAATATKGIVPFGAVNADAHQDLGGKYGVEGFPTIKVFGADKSKPTDYNGGRDVQDLVKGAMMAAQEAIMARTGSGNGGSAGGNDGSARGKSKVIELTESTFKKQVLDSKDTWIVAFTAPWCGHCKRLEPEFASASIAADGKAKFGNVDATAQQALAGKYNVQGYPTIKIFQNGEATDYEGGRTSSDLVQAAEEEFLKNMPPPEVKELVESDKFTTDCTSRQICFVAFFPTLEMAGKSDREAYINVMNKSAERYKRSPFGWTWAAAHQQPALESTFLVVDYPALVAINMKKSKFATMRGTFSSSGVGEFVNRLQAGRQATQAFDSFPDVEATVPWNGEDYVPEVYEEEFDLADLMEDDDEEESRDEL